MRVISQKITDFLSTLRLGLGWIADAGKKLVIILDEDPRAFDDILEESTSPWLTRDVLQTIEAIGRGTLAPEMLVLPYYVISRLAPLSVADQVRVINGVDVMVPPPNKARNGICRNVRKPASKFTAAEASRVIGKDGIISFEDQVKAREAREACLHNSIGQYQIVVLAGQDPAILKCTPGATPNYQKQRVKLLNGCALIELHT